MSKTVPFQIIQFCIRTQFSSIWTIDRTPSGATTSSQSESGSDGNEGVLCIPQSSSITRTSPSDCLVSYPRHSLGESYPSAEKQSVHYTAPADWAKTDCDNIYIYIYIYIYVCVCVCVYVCVYSYIHIYVCVCVSVCLCVIMLPYEM